MEDVFVEYLTDIEVAPGEQPRLYRAFVTRNGLSFERFTESAWVQDPMLPECLEAMGLVHVTPEHAGSTAADITAGRMDPSAHSPRFSEHRVREEAAFGMLDIAIFLTRHAAFAEYCDTRDGGGNGPETELP